MHCWLAEFIWLQCLHFQTELLEAIRAKDYGGEEDLLLGELQFAFITFLVILKSFMAYFQSNLLFCRSYGIWKYADGTIARSISSVESYCQSSFQLYRCSKYYTFSLMYMLEFKLNAGKHFYHYLESFVLPA